MLTLSYKRTISPKNKITIMNCEHYFYLYTHIIRALIASTYITYMLNLSQVKSCTYASTIYVLILRQKPSTRILPNIFLEKNCCA
jgi:hypothetical protein